MEPYIIQQVYYSKFETESEYLRKSYQEEKAKKVTALVMRAII